MSKMDISAVFEMFETINSKLDKRMCVQPDQRVAIPTETVNVDIEAVVEQLETLTEEIRNGKTPALALSEAEVKVEHRHTIDIASNMIFISLIVMFLMIMGLFFAVYEQRRTISQYKDSDLKYRYIKMQGQTDEENIYRLERQFRYGDSIKIIRKQVEKYEELIQEQAERMERARRNSEEAERLLREVEMIRERKKQVKHDTD